VSGLHHPSTCDSVMLLLKILSVSLYSMYLNVNPAYTSMCMYIQFAHSISSFFKFFFKFLPYFSKFCQVLKFFASITKTLCDFHRPYFKFLQVSFAVVCLRFFLGTGRVLTDWIPPPFSAHPPPHPISSLFKFLSSFPSFFQLFSSFQAFRKHYYKNIVSGYHLPTPVHVI
jgi:hypothetical protein